MKIDIEVHGHRFYLSLEPLPEATTPDPSDHPPTQLATPMRIVGFSRWAAGMSDAAYATSETKDETR